MTGVPGDMSDLVALLETERRLILEGRYAALGPMQDDKERLVARIGSIPPDAAVATRLRGLAESNLGLLAAARDGLAAVQVRLRELERLEQGGASYDCHGARVDGPSSTRTSRRV